MEASRIGPTPETDPDEEDAEQVEHDVDVDGEDKGDAGLAREVFERGYKALKGRGEKEDVSELLRYNVMPTTDG